MYFNFCLSLRKLTSGSKSTITPTRWTYRLKISPRTAPEILIPRSQLFEIMTINISVLIGALHKQNGRKEKVFQFFQF